MKKEPRGRVILSIAAWKDILLDAYGRQEIEACGALLGRVDQEGNWHVEEARPLRNSAASPVYFEFDPIELLSIDLEEPGRMVGVYHSHPSGPALASSTDRRNMRRVNLEQHIPWAWLIVSGPFRLISEEETDGDTDHGAGKTITARGLIAYHHYEGAGLQKIAIEDYQSHGDSSSLPL